MPEMVQKLSVVAFRTHSPPAGPAVALLLAIVQQDMSRVPASTTTAPPAGAVLPATVLLVSVRLVGKRLSLLGKVLRAPPATIVPVSLLFVKLQLLQGR